MAAYHIHENPKNFEIKGWFIRLTGQERSNLVLTEIQAEVRELLPGPASRNQTWNRTEEGEKAVGLLEQYTKFL